METQFNPFSIRNFNRSEEAIEITENTHTCSYISNIVAFETNEGIVLVDTGPRDASPHLAERLREKTDAPIHTVIYTHGHLDHAYGLEHYLRSGQDVPNIIAHNAVDERFDRYRQTQGHNEAINTRQFGGSVNTEYASYDDDGEGFRLSDEDGSYFDEPKYPPTTFYEDSIVIQVGEITLEIRHNKGETDDHSWIFCPEREVLCTGDFFVNVAPNAGNPQKVQRYPWEWADTLREMAGKEPNHLCPGHGEPVIDDSDEIQDRLLTTAEYLDTIVERTLDVLNNGSPPHVDIIHDVEIPEYDVPWLVESYDEGEFIVRNVIRYYGGWWSGRPSELKPSPRDALASEIASLAGDAVSLAQRAQQIAADGNLRLASHLADFAIEAAPNEKEVQEIVIDIYKKRATSEDNLMAANLYSSAVAYAQEGRAFR